VRVVEDCEVGGFSQSTKSVFDQLLRFARSEIGADSERLRGDLYLSVGG